MGPTVRVGGMQGFARLMRSLGHDPAPLLERCGLSEALLADEDARVLLQQAFDLIREAQACTGRSDIGLLAAQAQDISMLGSLALAMQNAPTVARAIDCLTRYLCVQSAALQMTLHPRSSTVPGSVELRYHPDALGGLQYVPQVVDHGLALAHLTLRALAGPRYALMGVSLTHRPAGSLRAFESLFAAPIHVRQAFGALHLSPAMMAVPIADAHPTLLRVATEHLERHAPRRERSLAARVRVALEHSLAYRLADKATVATMLDLHPRTLQRRLADEGTGFEALRDEVRRDAAVRWLARSDYSIAQVAGLVGFSEQSAFTRFCRDRLGATPSELRRRQRP